MIGCYDFGKMLLETNDLDPVYVLLWNSDFSPSEMERWLLAYWCFYHVGTSSWIADSPKGYWKRFRMAAESKEWPRCPERRHFRGANARKSYEYLKSRKVKDLFKPLEKGGTCEEVMKEVQKWVGFGPWIAFKVADMLERLDIAPVTFTTKSVYLFDSPKEGAERLRESLGVQVKDSRIEEWAVKSILEALGNWMAPPRRERLIGPQEAETILCKWKSYLNGHYQIGEDTESCEKGLKLFPKVEMAGRLLRVGAKKLW